MPTFPDLLPDRQYTAPAAAAAVGMASVAASWQNSPWVTVLASAPSDGLLTGITLYRNHVIYYGWGGSYEIDIAVGAGPTVIATFKVHRNGSWFADPSNEGNYIPCPIPIDGIVSGEPIKARIRAELEYETTTTWSVAVTYLRKPLTGVVESTTNPQYVLPSLAPLHKFTTSATPWADSSWHEYTVGGDRVVVGVVTYVPQAGMSFEIDIGNGGADALVTLPLYGVFSTTLFPGFVRLITPIRIVGDLSARVRTRIGGDVHVGFVCVDYPL